MTRDVPPFSLGGPDDYDVSPDGSEVCYSMNDSPVPAISTNADLYVVPIGGGHCAQNLHLARRRFQPPLFARWKILAWRSQTRAGYESDRWRLIALERATGHLTNLTENLDRWVNSFTWAPDSNALFFTTDDRGRQAIQMIPVAGGQIRVVASGESELDDMQLTRDGKTMVYTQQTGVSPVEIYPRVIRRRRARPTHAPQRRHAEFPPDHAARRILGRHARWRSRPELRRQAVWL